MTRKSKREIERRVEKHELPEVDEGIPRSRESLGRDLDAIIEDLDDVHRRQLRGALKCLEGPAPTPLGETSPAERQLADALTGGPTDHPSHRGEEPE